MEQEAVKQNSTTFTSSLQLTHADQDDTSEDINVEASSSSIDVGESDNYVCTCPWSADDQQSDYSPEGVYGICGAQLSASPSDMLYDELVHRDYACITHDDTDSVDTTLPSLSSDGNETDLNMMPFKITWSLGFTITANLLNFSSGTRKVFFLATAHKGILYDYGTNNMRVIHGHIKPLLSASVDETGQWLVTGGSGNGSKIIISDTYSCKQLLMLHNASDDYGSLILAMAPDATYFLAIHHVEAPVLRVWRWTYGKTVPDCEFSLCKHSLGPPQSLVFHPNDQAFFMIAFQKSVMLARWNDKTDQIEDFVQQGIPSRKLGHITDACMALNRHEVYVCTSTGHIAIYGNMLYTEHFREHPLNTNKIYVKAIKVVKTGINKMTYQDHIICILDDNGSLRFFTTDILLLYWIENEIPPIRTMSFSINLKKPHPQTMKLRINFDSDQIIGDKSEPGVPVEEYDRVMNYEALLKQNVRSRASLNRRPFVVRDFIAACQDGRIFHVDIVKGIYQPYFTIADSPVASVCVSSVTSLLYVAYETGRLSIFNYDTLQSIMTVTTLVHKRKFRLSKQSADQDENIIYNCLIKLSTTDLHLALARTNGEIIFLTPTLHIIPDQRYRYTNVSIIHMQFSDNNHYLAICDKNRTVIVLRYSETHWIMHIKVRAHTEKITDIMFVGFQNPRLFSIGEDRHLVEYCLDETMDLPVKNRVKIEDTAIPLCFLEYPRQEDGELYFLVANSEYKFKLIQEKPMKCRSLIVGPHHGCYETPVSGLVLVPNCNGKYLIFQNNNHMGIQKLPMDGSPYKHIGILANPKLGKIIICNQGKNVFTFSQGEGGILIWSINLRSVDLLHYIGGRELDPFYCYIDGGVRGLFFKEMEDLFCYTQILHKEDVYSRQNFSDSILIQDLPDVLRACGFYPSEYEVEQLIYEIQHKDFEKTGVLRDTITFIEFVKLFINHRPANGITIQEIQNNFNTLVGGSEEVTSHEFSELLCNNGEKFTPEGLNTCLNTLMTNDTEEYTDILDEIGPITFKYFTNKIIGILDEYAYSIAKPANRSHVSLTSSTQSLSNSLMEQNITKK